MCKSQILECVSQIMSLCCTDSSLGPNVNKSMSRLLIYSSALVSLLCFYFFPLVWIMNAAITGSQPLPYFSLLQSVKAVAVAVVVCLFGDYSVIMCCCRFL